MRKQNIPITLLACIVTLFTNTQLTNAGDLNPPTGSVGSTMKPLDDVEPRISVTSLSGDANALYVITTSGSYYLTKNITGQANKDGIRVEASDVTIDLGGFALIGVAGSEHGISDNGPGSLKRVRIINGTIRDWGVNGVSVQFASGELRNLRATGNGSNGLVIGGPSLVLDCAATDNGSDGIWTSGIIRDCAASSNNGQGITVGAKSEIHDCTSSNNGAHGINMSLGEGVIATCSALTNGLSGINVGSGTTVMNCTANQNQIDGIIALNGCTIRGCTTYRNTGDGIQVAAACTVAGNTCHENGFSSGNGAGIHATSVATRIEGNTVTDNDRGIDVDGTGNFVAKNRASSNSTDYDIVSGNAVASIINVAGNGNFSTSSTLSNLRY
ncbi:MAG: right-handed parallel beta-helix repeat-containing protein [Phycisphaerales bacterium]|nr:right-handed parallel beta-helix repeat-containing protein [Phycisphaerales bacterium]